MMTTAHLGEAGPHPVIASAARELRNKSENERSGVLSTAMSFLGLYRDPTVKWAGMEVGGIRISHMSHIETEKLMMLTLKSLGKNKEALKMAIKGIEVSQPGII